MTTRYILRRNCTELKYEEVDEFVFQNRDKAVSRSITKLRPRYTHHFVMVDEEGIRFNGVFKPNQLAPIFRLLNMTQTVTSNGVHTAIDQPEYVPFQLRKNNSTVTLRHLPSGATFKETKPCGSAPAATTK